MTIRGAHLLNCLFFISEHHQEHAHSAIHTKNPSKFVAKETKEQEEAENDTKPTAPGIC